MVGIGGFVGAIARYWLGSYIGGKMGTRFPYGTFVINMSGSFLIGLILTLLAERTHWNPNLTYLIPIGFIGAYTTFSTFEYETLRTVQDGQIWIAFLNISLSVVVGFAAVWIGVIAGKSIP
jgi:fluoride exporter